MSLGGGSGPTLCAPPSVPPKAPVRERVSFLDCVYLTREPATPAKLARPFALLFVGGLLTAASLAPASAWLTPWLAVLAVLVTPCALLWALLSAASPRRSDAYVAIRPDGVVVRTHEGAREELIVWEGLAQVYADARGDELVLTREAGGGVCVRGPFEDMDARVLSRRIQHAKRLALWNRLTSGTLDLFR